MNARRVMRLMAWMVVAACTARTGLCAVPDIDREKLRSLVELPAVGFQVGYSITSDQGATLAGEPMDLTHSKAPADRIAELKGQMTGGAGDAERFSELADLYSRQNDEPRKKAAHARAIELFREQAKDSPQQGWVLAQLGRELVGDGQKVEGRELVRKAVAMSPEDWRCWTSLGGVLIGQALETLGIKDPASVYAGLRGTTLLPDPNSPAWIDRCAKARTFRDEAKSCYDKAVSVAPREVKVYEVRAAMHFGVKTVDLLTGRGQGAPLQPYLLFAEMLDDLKKAAQLTSDDAYVIGFAAFADAMVDWSKQAGPSNDPWSQGMWPLLSDSTKSYVREATSRLEQLGRGSDKDVAGCALAALACLQLMVQRDATAAEANLRRSLELRPAGQAVWEMLAALMVGNQRWQDLAVLCEERARSKDSARNRIVLAKAYRKLGRPLEEVEKEAQAAVKTAPNDLLANTMLAAICLKQATSDEALAKAGQMMAEIKRSAFDAGPQDQQRAFEFLHGLYFGLAGNLAEARGRLQRLCEAEPGEARYREAYDALGPS